MTPFPPLETLVPHRGRMLLVSAILDHSPDETTCAIEIPADSFVAASDGTVPPWTALEYMAQTVAVHAGLTAWQRGEPVKLGFLIGSRRVEFHAPPRVGQSLGATVRRVWGEAALGLFACSLRDRTTGRVLAKGQLSVALSDAAGHFGHEEGS
jgi:predicted hotdog family 3-hydroxylacyl-ACP dehydratase